MVVFHREPVAPLENYHVLEVIGISRTDINRITHRHQTVSDVLAVTVQDLLLCVISRHIFSPVLWVTGPRTKDHQGLIRYSNKWLVIVNKKTIA